MLRYSLTTLGSLARGHMVSGASCPTQLGKLAPNCIWSKAVSPRPDWWVEYTKPLKKPGSQVSQRNKRATLPRQHQHSMVVLVEVHCKVLGDLLYATHHSGQPGPKESGINRAHEKKCHPKQEERNYQRRNARPI